MKRSKTHKQFLEDLLKRNKKYREGEFKVVSKYIKDSEKIVVRDKYGECLIKANKLMNGRGPSIQSAIDKTEYFLNKLRNKIGNLYYDYDFSEFEYISEKLYSTVICKKHGKFDIKPNRLLHGNRCKKCSLTQRSRTRLKNLEDFLSELSKNNEYYKNKNFTVIGDYEGNHTHIEVKSRYGIHSMIPQSLLKGAMPTIQTAIDKYSYFCNKSKHIHKNRYEYIYSEIKDTQSYVNIICETHGIFIQPVHSHLAGNGCNKCRKEYPKFSFSKWHEKGVLSKNFDSFKVYIIKCWNDKEEFYKIGKTYVNIESRFNNSNMPYNYKIIHIFASNDGVEVSQKEIEYLNKNKLNKYYPIKDFAGKAECFTNIEY